MIKLYNLEKYFNRNRSNEIHVINDINLTLPEKGLVVLLGPSGSGKTTLLNVLGGLDKTQSGTIDFDGDVLEKYSSSRWDHIRNQHIGYVFQNYNLLYDQSVYDNIALSLRMVGITDEKEIDTRIDYILERMGMINFKRRRAANLSGGQQQRVAIARALAKNPKVIIADEPTGNLDSKNTFDIMNILRSISKQTLVVLVTHEEEIANLYADRIIRLKDGMIISDESNNSTGGVDVKLETDIYLKDLNQITNLEGENVSYKVYSDEPTETNFDVKLIVKNKTLYLQVNSEDYKRVNLLTDGSEIKVYDKHFESQEMEEFVETDYDLKSIVDDSLKTERKTVISFKEAFRLGLNRFKNVKFTQALLYILFFLNSAIVGVALSLLFNAYTFDNVDFYSTTVHQVTYSDDLSYDQFKQYEDEVIEYMDMLNTTRSNIQLPKIYQTRGNYYTYSAYPVRSEYIDPSEMIYGRTVENQFEVVLSEHSVKQLLRNSMFESLGISRVEDILNIELFITFTNPDETEIKQMIKIVGVSEVDENIFYAKEETLLMMYTGVGVYEVFENQVTITDGAISNNYNTVLLDSDYTLDEDTYLFGIEGGNRVTEAAPEATFTADNEVVPGVLVPKEVLYEMIFDCTSGELESNVRYYTQNPQEALKVFPDQENAEYPFLANYQEYRQARLLQNVGFILFAGVFLGASALASFFVLRSSLLSRIYEVSVYRALGTPKRDLRKIFLVEAFILTLFTSLLGYLLTSYVLVRLQVMTEGFFEVVKITPLSFTIGLAIIFATNILSGIIPVSNLLRKTPSEIISRYDF